MHRERQCRERQEVSMFQYVQRQMAQYGNLDALVTPELVEYAKTCKTIVVAGYPRSGKSILTKTLSEMAEIPYVFSDDYLDAGLTVPEATYQLMSDMIYNDEQMIFEGTLTSKALAMAEGKVDADLVIFVNCDSECIEWCYYEADEGHKYDYTRGLCAGICNEFSKYAANFSNKASVIVIDTTFEFDNNDDFSIG